MTRFIVPLLGSLVIGIVCGHLFFRTIFVETVPPAVLTSFNRGTAHTYFIVGGLLLGIVIFVWSLLVAGLIKVTGGRRGKDKDVPAR